jgi:hypothetical protein
MANKAEKNKLEGEGNYSATRRYNAQVAEHVRTADVDGLARKAAKALEGPEAAELREAERKGKRGPRGAPTPRAKGGVTARR